MGENRHYAEMMARVILTPTMGADEGLAYCETSSPWADCRRRPFGGPSLFGMRPRLFVSGRRWSPLARGMDRYAGIAAGKKRAPSTAARGPIRR